MAGLFLSSLSGGLDVGFSLVAIAAVVTLAGGLEPLIVQLFVATAYSIGFIFVVMGRSELFTEQTTLAVLPVLHRRAGLADLARLWVIVYTGNMIGAAVFAAIAAVLLPAAGIAPARLLGELAVTVAAGDALTIFISAVLAGWLMGLMSWLVTAGRDTISQIAFVWLVTGLIGFAGLHHAILGTVEVLAGVLTGAGPSIGEFLRFVLLATVGNAVGGTVFVALLKYSHSVRGTRLEPVDLEPPSP